jgi:long-chain acyl-CoA synthetase
MDFNSLCEDSRAKGYILEELSKIGKEKKVLSNLSFLLLF